MAGITADTLRVLLSPEDLVDIAAGGIHRKTLRAFAEADHGAYHNYITEV